MFKPKESSQSEYGRGKSLSPFRGRPRTKPMSLEEENKNLKMENEFLKKLRANKGGESEG